jgi:hypothetical protein
MGTIRRNGVPNARPSNPTDHTADGQELVSAEREQLNWTQTHEREVNRPGADLAQITTHHDLDGRLEAIEYQRFGQPVMPMGSTSTAAPWPLCATRRDLRRRSKG